MAKKDPPEDEGRQFTKQRLSFTTLIATNPNYFGNLPDFPEPPELVIKGNTTYEELTCVAFNPGLDLLEATVEVKLPSGFSGDLCHAGSTEFVRFYVDYGPGWQDAGLASFKAHDIPTAKDCAGERTAPLTYAVTLPHDPRRGPCSQPTLPNVRAILSWQTAPPAGNPGWGQVWGNTLDRHVFVKPRPRRFFEFFPERFTFPIDLEWLVDEPIPLPDPPPELTFPQLVKQYTEAGPKTDIEVMVEPQRFGMADIQAALAPGLFSENVVAAKIVEWKAQGLDWVAAVKALEDTQGNVSYEELDCVGLDYNREWLVANFAIKRPTGYSGTPCRGGSLEYVAFWVDYDDRCDWTYAGTTSVKVHDVAALPDDGLHYWVGVPAGLGPHRRRCEEPKIGRVRAVLSWSIPPSTIDPDDVPHWGNRLDTHVEIKPGRPASLDAEIDIIGGISVSQIDVAATGTTLAGAVFAEWGSPADPFVPTRQCPFGGRVNVQADAPAAFALAGHKYRLVTRRQGTVQEHAVTTPFLIASGVNPPVLRHPDTTTGLIGYVSPEQNVFNMLGWWETGNITDLDDDALWEIRLEMFTAGDVFLGATGWHRVQLDNTAPQAAIEIDAGGDCKDFNVGTAIPGHFVARDLNFGHWRLNTLPASLGPPDPVSATPISSPTALPPGDAWTLDTDGLQPCGYVVEVEVWDRAIVGSRPGIHNSARDDTGLCLRQGP